MHEHHRRDFLARAVCAAGAISTSRAVAQTASATGVGEQELEFQSRGATLSAALVFPAGPPIAAITLVHGSGKVERMLGVARLLASDGFAVLTYDKRGVGNSGGTYEGQNNISAANLDLLANDAVAALTTLQEHLRFRNVPVGFIGFSQAGWIIPIAAARSPAARFIGLFSGPVCTTSEQLDFQEWTQDNPDFWKTHSREQVTEHMKSVRYRPDDVDPRVSLTKLSVPGLWLYGDRDILVPVDLSVDRLQGLEAQGHKFESRIVPNHGHELLGTAKAPAHALMVERIKSIASGR